MLLARLVRAVVIAGAASAVTLAQLNLPDKKFWDDRDSLLWVSVALVAFFSCYDAVRTVRQAVQVSKIREYERDLRAALSATVTLIVNEFGVPWDEIAVYHYQCRGRWRWRRLVKVDGARAGVSPVDAQRSFQPNCGLVGIAFHEGIPIAVEWADFVRAAQLYKDARARWRGLPHRDRYGLTWGQLMHSDVPEGMVARPIFDVAGRAIGCMLITGPLKKADLDSIRMGNIMRSLAAWLNRIGPAPRGWWNSNE